MKLYGEIVEQCEKVKQSGGTTEKWNSTVEQCGKVWNNVAEQGNSVAHGSLMEKWNSIVER